MCGFVRSSFSSCEVTNEIHYFLAFSEGGESAFVKIFCPLKSQASMTEEINYIISHWISLFPFLFSFEVILNACRTKLSAIVMAVLTLFSG